MPKPYFLRRPAGLYVRFFVPTDLQTLIGSRYLVRPVRLSHAIRNKAEAVYRRGALIEKRRSLMQAWTDYLLPRSSSATNRLEV